MARHPEVFIVSTGVSGNLGDAVIRRRVLRWFETDAPRHVYIGRTTPGWLDQLELPADDHVYRAGGRRAWLKKLAFGRGPRVLVFDPGEVPLGREHAKSEFFFLLLTVWLRLRRAHVVRPPRAIAHYDRVTGTLHRWGCRLSHTVMWRDEPSLTKMRCGELVPDTAFGEPATDGASTGRRRLLVSLRAARPVPPQPWFDAVGAYADAHGLTLTFLSQVDEDEPRTAELADRFADREVELVRWDDLGAHGDLEREQVRRSLYTECVAVISDRLHVLLLAAKAGAVPLEIVEAPVPKATTHFATAGIHTVTLDATGRSAAEIEAWMTSAIAAGPTTAASVVRAGETLDARVSAVRAAVGL